MPDGRPFDLLLRQLLDQVNAASAVPPAPIKLTKAQLDQLHAKLPAGVVSDSAAAYFSTPIVLVDSTAESTPYLDGWIKCPSCGKPAVTHGEVLCDRVLVFGPFGDFVVRRPRSFFGADSGFERGVDAMIGFQRDQQRLLSDPGFTPGDLLRIKAGLFALAADGDEELASAIARWDNDGGCCA